MLARLSRIVFHGTTKNKMVGNLWANPTGKLPVYWIIVSERSQAMTPTFWPPVEISDFKSSLNKRQKNKRKSRRTTAKLSRRRNRGA